MLKSEINCKQDSLTKFPETQFIVPFFSKTIAFFEFAISERGQNEPNPHIQQAK